jgi:branched-chain amino acid transport system substrate-binding protein
MTRRRHRFCMTLALLAAGVFIASFPGCKNDQTGSGGGGGGNTIVIGHYGSMTGPTATFGVSTDEGIRLALDEINGAGGVLGKQIEVRTEDDQGKPTEAVNAVEKLINRDKVVAVIGEVASTNSLAAAPVCQAAGIPMLTPASTNPEVTKRGDFIFRSCFIDPFQGGVMAKFAINDLKAKRFAILYDVQSDYSKGLRQFFSEEIKRGGGQVVADEAYNQSDVDFRGQLTKIKNTNPEAIYVPGYYTQVGAISRQAKELGIAAPLLGGDGWDSDKLYEIGGETINDNYFTNHYSIEEQRPEVQKFVADYRKKYNGKTPDAMAILGYDAMKLMADAIKRAGTTDGAKVRDALASTANFPGASGAITIDKQRNAQKPIVILKIVPGKTPAERTKFVTSIKP